MSGSADVHAVDGGGATALFAGSARGHAAVVSMLISVNADVDAADSNGVVPLLLASSQGHVELASVLLAAAADVHTSTHRGQTAMMAASAGGHAAVVNVLCGSGDFGAMHNDASPITTISNGKADAATAGRVADGNAGTDGWPSACCCM